MKEFVPWCNLSETLCLLSAVFWVHDLHLSVVNFEFDLKTVVDSLYGGKCDISNFSAVIQDCRHMLAFDLVTSDVRFIWRQANEVTHKFAMTASHHSSFHIYIRISSCISAIIMNKMQ